MQRKCQFRNKNRIRLKAMSIFAIKVKLVFGRRFLFLDLGGVGVSGTPLGVTQKSFELFAF